MGKTKIKVIDASQPEVEGKRAPKKERAKSELTRETSTVIASEAKQSGSEKVPTQIATEPEAPRNDKNKVPQKAAKAKPRSKKYLEVSKDVDRTKTYPIPQAVDMVKKLSYAKFNATLEAHINTTVQSLRGLVTLPFASGQKIRILAFGPSTSLRVDNNVTLGDDKILEEISNGKVNFDLIITTPEWIPKLAKVAKILGPKGLMPNPKNGTITSGEDGLKKAVEGFQTGKTEYKTESKAPIIHLTLGKLNQPTEELSQNIQTLLQSIGKTKIKKVSLSPTMGPSVKLDLSSL